MDNDSAPVLDALLAERPFVQHVTRRLAGRDAHAADDLEQEVWAAALKNPPRDTRSVRGWLRRVARSQLVERLRGQGRATLAEERAARIEATESAEDKVTRSDACEHLAQALRALEEPYRSVIVLRFVEDLPPREVAKRLNRPVETVRTQTRRALATLRERLEREHGGKRTSALLGLLLLDPPSHTGVATSTWLAAATLIASGTLAWVAWRTGGVDPALDQQAPATRGVAQVLDESSGVAPGVLLAREDFEPTATRAPAAGGSGPSSEPDALPLDEDPARNVDILALDGLGRPIGAASVWSHVAGTRRLRGRTDTHGRLSVPVEVEDLLGQDGSWILPDDGVEFALESAGHVARSVVVLLPEEGDVQVPLTLSGPAWRLEGRVLGPDGRSLSGVEVVIVPAEGVGTRQAVEGTTRAIGVVRPRGVTTDERGSFRVEGLPTGTFLAMAWAPGHAIALREVELNEQPTDLVELELEACTPLTGTVRQVTHLDQLHALTLAEIYDQPATAPEASPSARAHVEYRLERPGTEERIPLPPAWHRTRTDEDGRFELPRPATGTIRLRAREAGPSDDWATKSASGSLELEAGRPARWDVQLQHSMFGVRVEVVDGSGDPLPELYVVLREGGQSGDLSSTVTNAEGQAWLRAEGVSMREVDVYASRSKGVFPWATLPQPADPREAFALRRVVLEGFPHGTARVHGGLPLAQAETGLRLRVHHLASGNTHAWEIDARSGGFDLNDLPPGRYRFEVESDAGLVGSFGEHSLAAGDVLVLERLLQNAR